MARIIVSLLLGLISGVISKAGDVAATVTFGGDVLWNIGLITSGFLIWCLIGYYNAASGQSLKQAVVSNAVFFASLFVSYYLYSYFIAEYFNIRIVLFWLLMLIPVMVLTYLLRKYRGNRIFTALSLAAACGLFILDVFFIQGIEWIPLLFEILLLTCIIVLIIKYNSAVETQKNNAGSDPENGF